MKEVGAFEAKNTLSALLDLVEQGEEVVITRHGKPVARLVPPKGKHDPEEVRAAMRRIRERADSCGRGITLEEALSWRDEGRR